MEESPKEYSQLLKSDIEGNIKYQIGKKACGTDNLYANVFRNEGSLCICYSFFNYCFQNDTVCRNNSKKVLLTLYI